MKQKDKKALHDKTVAELNLMLKDLKADIAKLSLGVEKVKNVHLGSVKKKDIARILTILNEKKVEDHG